MDHTDIKVVVRYPHTKLNPEFVKAREFDSLSLLLLAAGEIELILRTKTEEEKEARLRMLLIMLYHSQYIDIAEIRDQYDAILKELERKELHWSDKLHDKLDRALDRRARAVERERVCMERDRNYKSKEVKKQETKQKIKDEELVYCIGYNRGTCPEPASHKGRFVGKDNVLKHHCCKKCWIEKGVKANHSEHDKNCPQKA